MPCGTAFMNSAVASATSLPSSRMLAPLVVTTPMPSAGDAQRHALRGALDRAGRHHVVLLGERIEQCLRGNPQRRQLGMRELDENPLVLGAVEIDFCHSRYLQQPLAHALGGLL